MIIDLQGKMYIPYRQSDPPAQEDEYALRKNTMSKQVGLAMFSLLLISSLSTSLILNNLYKRIAAHPERVIVRTEVTERVEKIAVNTDDGACRDMSATMDPNYPNKMFCQHKSHTFTVVPMPEKSSNTAMFMCMCPLSGKIR